MNEPTKTLLGDMALAGGCAVIVGALVGCALVPLLVWWRDRKVGGEVESGGTTPRAVPGDSLPAVVRGGDRSPTFPPVTSSSDDIALAEAVERLVGGHQP